MKSELTESRDAVETDGKQVMVEASTETSAGSVMGGALLFAGTAIGAGMLALPAETAAAGYLPSQACLFGCWLFTYVSSLITLQATWIARQRKLDGDDCTGFLSVATELLGSRGRISILFLFWFLLTAIIVAYTSEGSRLLTLGASWLGFQGIPEYIGCSIFLLLFASISVAGTRIVDSINRWLCGGLIVSFVSLVNFGLPMIRAENLQHADWNAVWPYGISVGILSFGGQNVVPTILDYLGGDMKRARQAVLYGTLIPLAVYSVWEVVFLGIIPQGAAASKEDIVHALGPAAGNGVIQALVTAFSVFAITSSMAGASASFIDFWQDSISSISAGLSSSSRRLLAAALALSPPFFIALQFKGVFLRALENAGLIGGLSLYGIFPAFALLSYGSRKLQGEQLGDSWEAQLRKQTGGSLLDRIFLNRFALLAVVVGSSFLLLSELLRLLLASHLL